MEQSPRRGFASMDPERQRQLASLGGKAVKAETRSFHTDRELAREAGRKGGKSVPDEKRTFSRQTDIAREAGRKGGMAKRRSKHEGASA